MTHLSRFISLMFLCIAFCSFKKGDEKNEIIKEYVLAFITQSGMNADSCQFLSIEELSEMELMYLSSQKYIFTIALHKEILETQELFLQHNIDGLSTYKKGSEMHEMLVESIRKAESKIASSNSEIRINEQSRDSCLKLAVNSSTKKGAGHLCTFSLAIKGEDGKPGKLRLRYVVTKYQEVHPCPGNKDVSWAE